jgi:uncharacterized protein YggU (UPF0235/DUF167 family)
MYIKVDVTVGAKRESVTKTGPDSFAVSVREKAERNMANRRVLELIRSEFGGTGVLVKIISGHHSPRKILAVEILEKAKKG